MHNFVWIEKICAFCTQIDHSSLRLVRVIINIPIFFAEIRAFFVVVFVAIDVNRDLVALTREPFSHSQNINNQTKSIKNAHKIRIRCDEHIEISIYEQKQSQKKINRVI